MPKTTSHLAEDDDFAKLNRLISELESGKPLNLADLNGRTRLHQAAAIGNHTIISMLIFYGADELIYDHQNNLPLDLAKQHVLEKIKANTPGYKEAYTRYLRTIKANSVESLNDDPQKLIQHLVLLDRYTARKKLLITAEYFGAAQSGDLDNLEKIFDLHIKNNRWLNINMVDENRYTAIEYCASNGHIDCFNWFKSKGATCQTTDGKRNALLLSLTQDQLETFTNTSQALELYDAAEKGDKKALIKLLAANAPHVICKDGLAPIHIVANKGRLDCLIFLISKNISIDMPDANGLTPLHHAIKADKKNCFDYLIAHNACTTIPTKQHETAADFAKAGKNPYYRKIIFGENIENASVKPPPETNKKSKKAKKSNTKNPTIKNLNTNSTTSNLSTEQALDKSIAQPSTGSDSLNNSSTKFILSKVKPTNPKPAIATNMLSCDAKNYSFKKNYLPGKIWEILNTIKNTETLTEQADIWLTGGAVRTCVYNYLFQQQLLPIDYDLVTNLPLLQIKNILEKKLTAIQCNIEGINNKQSLTIIIDSLKIDIAQIDIDPSISDVSFNLENNAMKRDVYINAMYIDPFAMRLYYLPKALEDFSQRIMTTIRDPITILMDGPALLLRLLRIAHTLNFKLSASLAEAAQNFRQILETSQNFFYGKFYNELLALFKASIIKYNHDKIAGIQAVLALFQQYAIDISLLGIKDQYLGWSSKHGPAIDIFTAACTKNIEALQAAFSKNISFNQINANHDTPLKVAAENRHVECCSYLLLAGATIEPTLSLLKNKTQSLKEPVSPVSINSPPTMRH